MLHCSRAPGEIFLFTLVSHTKAISLIASILELQLCLRLLWALGGAACLLCSTAAACSYAHLADISWLQLNFWHKLRLIYADSAIAVLVTNNVAARLPPANWIATTATTTTTTTTTAAEAAAAASAAASAATIIIIITVVNFNKTSLEPRGVKQSQ